MTGDFDKRRNVENLTSHQLVARRNHPLIIMMKKIAMALTKRIRHIRQHSPQPTFCIKAKPESHRVKRMAQDTRHGHQQYFTGGRGNAPFTKTHVSMLPAPACAHVYSYQS